MSIRKRESKKTKGGYVYEVYFNYEDNGVTTRHSKSGFLTKKEAQEYEALMLAQIHDTGRILKDCKKTLADVLEEFLEVDKARYQANTLYDTKQGFSYVKEVFGNTPISKITYKMLQTFFNSRSDQGLETNKRIRKTLNRLFDYAIRAGYIKDNPNRLVIVSGVERTKEKGVLSFEDFNTLINYLDSKNDFYYSAYSIAMKIAFYTGLRSSEVLALEKKDFDFTLNQIDISKKLVTKGLKKEQFYATREMKSKKSKAIIPMPNILRNEIIQWFSMNPYEKVVCDIEGNYINPTSLSNRVKAIAQQFNINFNFHMLRHTYATTLVMNNVDIKTTQELMRHSNFNTTLSLYTHIDNEHKKEVVNSVFEIKSVEKVSNLENQNSALS